jgi:BMFP domain-containing protein YqiC
MGSESATFGAAGLAGAAGRIEDMVRQLVAGLPPLVGAARGDLELHFRRVLQEQFARLDLCSRSDFDAQSRVLERAQARLAALEARLVALEQRAAASGEGGAAGA